MRISRSQIIFRPPSTVFKFYAVDHVRNHPRWDPDMKLESVTPGPIGVGTIIKRRHAHFAEAVEGTMEITAFESDKRMAAVIKDGPVEMRSEVVLEPMFEGDGTLVRIDIDIPGMDDKLDPRLIERTLNNMKQLIEAET